MCKCSQFDETTGRCRSGWARIFPVCRGMGDPDDGDRLKPYCMRDDPPKQFLRDDGLPIGWPVRLQAQEAAKAGSKG